MHINRWKLLCIILLLCSIPYLLFTWYSENEGVKILSTRQKKLDSQLSFGSTERIPPEYRKPQNFGQRAGRVGKLSTIKVNVVDSSNFTFMPPSFVAPLRYRPSSAVSGSTTGDIIDNPLDDHTITNTTHQQPRVAVIIPYIGGHLPSWFDMFALSAKASAKMFDWLLFITDAPYRAAPDNVKLIRLSLDEFVWRFAEIDDEFSSSVEGKAKLAQYFRQLVTTHPYTLVELKPALGFLFKDYLEGYSHWAYADLDTIVGRIHLHLSPSMLSMHDIITFSFGDSFRAIPQRPAHYSQEQ